MRVFFLLIEAKKSVKHMVFGHPTPHVPGKNKVWQIFGPGSGGLNKEKIRNKWPKNSYKLQAWEHEFFTTEKSEENFVTLKQQGVLAKTSQT